MSKSTPVKLPAWASPDPTSWVEYVASSKNPVQAPSLEATPDNATGYRKYFGLPATGNYDYDKPASTACYKDAVFVSIDFEAKENHPNQGLVFEAGIASLDSRDTVASAPGDRGINWIKKFVKYKHFRIAERPFQNRKYCPGNPGEFLFGQSQWCRLENVAQDIQDYVNSLLTERTVSGEAPRTPTRHLVLIAHACNGDKKYAQDIGLKWPLADNVQIVDTQPLAVAVVLKAQKPGPAVYKMLNAVGLSYWDIRQEQKKRDFGEVVKPNYLHNSGNDAAFELQGLVAMIVMTTDQYGTCLIQTNTNENEVYQAGLPLLPQTWEVPFRQLPNPLQTSNHGLQVAPGNNRPTNTKPMPNTAKHGADNGVHHPAVNETKPAEGTYTVSVKMSQKERKKLNQAKKTEEQK